jgi:4-hydroxy-tetrahydrodipicolinate synthase
MSTPATAVTRGKEGSVMDDLSRQLRTVVAITVTPFDDAGRPDEAAYTRIVERMVGQGVRAVTPNGNTSEFYALHGEERRRCVELTVKAAGDAVVVAGVGHDIATATADAQAAQRAGAACVMVHQPVHPFRSVSGWVDYHAEIAAAVPDMGVVPYVKDDAVDTRAMAALLEACPTIVAVKYATADPTRFAVLVNDLADAPVSWLCGLAEGWAPFFAVAGASGFTSGLVNVDPSLSLRLWSALDAGDVPGAMAIWQATRAFEELRARNRSENNVSVVKEALAQLGLCSRAVRPPISLLDEEDRANVAAILESWNRRA